MQDDGRSRLAAAGGGRVTASSPVVVPVGEEPRARRPVDAATVIVGILLIGWGVRGIDRQTPWERAFTDLFTASPSWLKSLLAFGSLAALVYGVGIVVVLIAGGVKGRGALRDVLVAAAGSMVLAVVLTRTLTGEWPYVLPALGLEDPDPRFPVLRVVVVTAILLTASPHLSRPIRRLGWLMITVSAVAAVALGYGVPSDVTGGLGIGLVAAGGVLLVAGSPRGYPDPAAVADAMRRMGLSVAEVWIDPKQTWGVRSLGATTDADAILAVKAYGRDASDSQLMAKAWRALWYREDGRRLTVSRLQAVEHEALVTMMAGRAGVPASEVLAAGRVSPDLALLVLEEQGRPLDEIEPDQVSDDLIVALWEDIARLHAAGIAHGSLTAGAVHIQGDDHQLRDFGLGSLVATEPSRCLDVVELLFSLTLQVGTERAVRTARDGVGDDVLVEVLPYLQLPAVSAGTRGRADKPRNVMKELQAAVVEATGQQLPEPVKLRRVSGRSLAMTAMIALAAWALIPLIGGIDYAAVWEVLQDADWALIVMALIVGQTMFIPQATSMMFAVSRELPFWPLVTLQIATQFIGLAVPSVAGRVAMNAAFLHKFGVSVAASVAQGAIDGFAGFIVQAIILLMALFSGEVDLGLDVAGEDIEWGLVLLIVGLLVVVTVTAVFRIRKIRDRVLPILQEGWGSLRAVLDQPSRALGLLAANLGNNLVLGGTLWLVLHALNDSLSFGSALVAVVATFLLQGLVPIPGGVGVAEAVMTSFLVALGVEETVAFAATVTYRVITFYLPALEGLFAMRWLERNDYL